jgi:hypothetical protein
VTAPPPIDSWDRERPAVDAYAHPREAKPLTHRQGHAALPG